MISFDADFAKKYGLIEAIIFERIKILLEKNMHNFQNYYHSKFWVDLNHHVYSRFLFFLTQQELDYALENLQKNKLIEELKINNHSLFTISDSFMTS